MNILSLELSHSHFSTKTKDIQESFQQQKMKQKNHSYGNDYYHKYFNNKAKIENVNTNSKRKKLKKPMEARKTERERRDETQTSRLKIEYRIIGGVILLFTSLIGYYFYYISGSKIGKADTYYKTAIDYELECNLIDDENKRNELIKKTDYYYQKCLEYTDYSYPKYLYKYSKFLLYIKDDCLASEHYITKALGLHETNAIYHKFYCILLKYLIEKKGNIDRLQDYYSQKMHTIKSHIQEAKYFLNEENNEKAAIMHFDYALNFCNETINKLNTKLNYDDKNIIKIKENVEEMKIYKIQIYQDAANLLQEYGFNKISEKYWKDGINEFGEDVHVMYGVSLYQKQQFDKAMEIFDLYCKKTNKNNKINMIALIFKARILMEICEYTKALNIYSSILPQIGIDPMVIGDMIYILIEMNKINEANSLMKHVITLIKKLTGNDDLILNAKNNYLNMMFILLKGKLNQIETANYQCLEMVNKYPSDFEVNYFAALYYHKYGKNYDKADRYYRNAISIEDQWAKVYYNYSLLFLQNNDKAQFLKYIKIAYEKNSNATIPHIKKLYKKYFDQDGRILIT